MENVTSTFNASPNAVRRHIAIFGRRNVGKSSLLNALAGQQVAIVSPEAGTTTDPVNRAIELHPMGPCLLIDTAGFDDEGVVGTLRNDRTARVVDQADLALLVTDAVYDYTIEQEWLQRLNEREVPTIVVLNKCDTLADSGKEALRIEKQLRHTPVLVSAVTKQGLEELRASMARLVTDEAPASITGSLASPGDTVLLVMPQDRQAPKGRLILPQVQTIRDLLDKDCTVLCCTAEGLQRSLASLRVPPRLIVTDSQVFPRVKELTPTGTKLTSFSVLMAGVKGDLKVLSQGAQAIDSLTPSSRVLIAEACTHAPLSEDIGREQIPRIIRKRVGMTIQFDICAGKDFPSDLTKYDLIIHCGACMFNRRMMLSRIARACQQGVPITNYGLALAHLHGIEL